MCGAVLAIDPRNPLQEPHDNEALNVALSLSLLRSKAKKMMHWGIAGCMYILYTSIKRALLARGI